MNAIQEVLDTRYNGNVSQYGWIVDDKKIQCSYNGCHSQILSYPTGKVSYAWSMGPNIPDIRLEYIFDEKVSPWRALLPSIITTKEQVKAGSPFIYGDLDIDANLIVNHMVSVRWPSEQIFSYAMWERLVLNFVHPAVADVLTALLATRHQQGKPYDPDKPRFTTTQLMHSNFIALDCTKEYVENFVNGKLEGGNGLPFAKTRTVGTANDYAGGTAKRGYKPIVGAFGKFAGLSFSDQLRGKLGEYQQFIVDTYGELKDFNHLVEIGRKEQVRLGLEDWAPGQRHARGGVHKTPAGVGLDNESVKKYESDRMGRSHWSYVQGSSYDTNHAHPF